MLNILGSRFHLVELVEGGEEPSHIGELEHRSRELQAGTVPPWNVEVTGDGLDQEDGNRRPRSVVGLVTETVPIHQGHGLDRPHHAGDLIDLLNGYSCDFAGPLGRELLYVLGQLVEAIHPVVTEIVIVKVFSYDDMKDSEREGSIGAWANRNPDIGVSAQGVEHWADVDCDHSTVALVEAVGVLPPRLVYTGVLLVMAPAY